MPNDFHWGPTNPHPLSQMRTELVWDGKYDEFGNRREVDVAACAMPMQKIETVDEPRQRAAAEGQTDMFEQQMLKMQETAPACRRENGTAVHCRIALRPIPTRRNSQVSCP